MRILLAVGSLRLGGTETQVARLACELQARGHDVTVLCLQAEGELLARLQAAGIPVLDLGGRHRWAPIPLRPWRLVLLPWRLRRLRPDVAHAFLLEACFVVMPAALLARIPRRLCGWRGTTAANGPMARISWLLQAIVGRCAHGHTVNAAAVAESLPRLLQRQPVATLPNGVDVPAAAADPGREPAEAIIVANLLPYKGHLDLVRALTLLPRPPVVHCYGDGPERDAVHAAVQAAGLDGVVRLHGSVTGAASAYLQAQLALLASHEEGLPNALLEAMAAGLPCVATAVGGVPGLVEHEVTGLLVPAHDPLALAAAIQRLLDDAPLRRKLGAAARERAQAFSWDACARRHEEHYGAG